VFATSSALTAPSAGSSINVSNVSQLMSAVASLQSNKTIMIATGTYNLTDTLWIPQGISNWGIRGVSNLRYAFGRRTENLIGRKVYEKFQLRLGAREHEHVRGADDVILRKKKRVFNRTVHMRRAAEMKYVLDRADSRSDGFVYRRLEIVVHETDAPPLLFPVRQVDQALQRA
jgi:hypothetical protein